VTRKIAALLAVLSTPALAQQTVPLDTQPLDDQAFAVQPAAPTLRATYGDWEIRCISENDCVMTQLHRRSQQSADAVFTVVKPKGLAGEDGQVIEAFAEIVVPLGVYLPGGLGVKVDDQPAKAAPYERCIDEGCVVRAPISATMLANMKAGATAYLVVFGGPERPVQIPISLAGFTAAYDSF